MAYSTAPTFPSFSALPGITLPITRSPIWRTLHSVSIAGVDVPSQPWTYGRYRWKLSAAFLRQAAAYAEYQTLLAFFNARGGSAQVFQYADPNDGTVSSTVSQSVGTGDSTAVAFQLVRALGGFVEPVFAISTITSIKVGSSVVSTAAWSISSKGILTFSSTAIPPSGQSVVWAGTYNWFCRFDQDTWDFQQITASSDSQGPLWSVSDLSFTSIKFGA